LISNPTAISTTTGVFHFMAVSLDLNLRIHAISVSQTCQLGAANKHQGRPDLLDEARGRSWHPAATKDRRSGSNIVECSAHVLAVFAVCQPNYQPSTPHTPRKSWTADGLTNEEQRVAGCFFRCFPLFLLRTNARIAMAALPPGKQFSITMIIS
jgi:hypothetical protein